MALNSMQVDLVSTETKSFFKTLANAVKRNYEQLKLNLSIDQSHKTWLCKNSTATNTG